MDIGTTSVKYMFQTSKHHSLGEQPTDSESDSDSEWVEKRKKKLKRRQTKELSQSFLKLLGTDLIINSIKCEETSAKSEEDNVGEPGLFVIDATGGAGNLGVKKKERQYTPLDPGVDLTKNLYVNLDVLRGTDWTELDEEKKQVRDIEKPKQKDLEIVTKLMKKATFKPSLEKNPVLPRVSKTEMKRRRKAEREKTKGRDWFDMPATEMTEERRKDLEIMQIRDALDPKRRYRSDDRTVLPKYFQVGTIVEDATDFYSSRVPRKQRKQTIVDELLADAEFQKRSKRKYSEIVREKMGHRGPKYNRDGDDDGGERKMKKKKKRKMKI